MPLGDGKTWDETAPTNSTDLRDGDDHQLQIKKGVRIRQEKEHVWPSSQGTAATAGYHKYITFQPQTTNPSSLIAGTTGGAIAFVTYGTGTAMVIADSAGNNIRINDDAGNFNSSLISYSGQAAGDSVYAINATTFGGVALGSAGHFLVVNGTTGPAFGNTISSLVVSGTSVFTGNVVMTGSASIGGALAVTGAITAGVSSLLNQAVGVVDVSATGDVAVTGVGFIPSVILFFGGRTTAGQGGTMVVGVMTATKQHSAETHSDNANMGCGSSVTAIIGRYGNGSPQVLAFDYVSMDADGFTINVSDAYADVTMMYLALA